MFTARYELDSEFKELKVSISGLGENFAATSAKLAEGTENTD
jgi:hypothetical protein